MSDLREWTSAAVKELTRRGADEAEAFVVSAREIAVSVENNQLKTATSQAHEGIGLRAHRARSLGFASVNQLDEQAISEAVSAAAALAAATPPSPYNQLPGPSDLREVPGLYDPHLAGVDVSAVAALAQDMVTRIRDEDARVVIESGDVTAVVLATAVANSLGVLREQRTTLIAATALTVAREGEQVSSFQYETTVSRTLAGLRLEDACKDLVGRTVSSLGAGPGESFLGTIVLSPGALAELLIPILVHSVSADSVQKGMSRFAGKMGQAVASDLVTVTDDGTMPGGPASQCFDREGVSPRPVTIMGGGVLEGLLHNHQSALRANVKSTGHAAGGYRNPPGAIGATNLVLSPGADSKEDLIDGIDRGLLVTRFSGQPNAISGEFSGVVKGGFLIRSGRLTRPVMGTLIAGNVFDLLPKVSGVSSDTKWVGSASLPYLRIEDVSVTAAQ
jgi:PmbA protein